MLAILLLVSAFQVSAAMPIGSAGPCDYAQHLKQLNLPPNTTSNETEIDHAASVLYEGKAVGWLLQTVKGQLFYQDGPINASNLQARQPADIATMVIESFGLKPNTQHIQLGSIYTVSGPPRLDSIADKAIEIKGCY